MKTFSTYNIIGFATIIILAIVVILTGTNHANLIPDAILAIFTILAVVSVLSFDLINHIYKLKKHQK